MFKEGPDEVPEVSGEAGIKAAADPPWRRVGSYTGSFLRQEHLLVALGGMSQRFRWLAMADFLDREDSSAPLLASSQCRQAAGEPL